MRSARLLITLDKDFIRRIEIHNTIANSHSREIFEDRLHLIEHFTASDIDTQSELIDIGRTAVDGYLRERLYE